MKVTPLRLDETNLISCIASTCRLEAAFNWLRKNKQKASTGEDADSGFVEGFNNKVKVLKRQCYGMTNLKHFFQRIFLVCLVIDYILIIMELLCKISTTKAGESRANASLRRKFIKHWGLKSILQSNAAIHLSYTIMNGFAAYDR